MQTARPHKAILQIRKRVNVLNSLVRAEMNSADGYSCLLRLGLRNAVQHRNRNCRSVGFWVLLFIAEFSSLNIHHLKCYG
jgi:hypothetical protein